MKKYRHQTQIALICLGLLLVFLTYFYYPNMKKDISTKDNIVKKELDESVIDKEDTSFENVEYKGMYDLDKSFTVKSESAYISNEEPDLVHMNNMSVILYLNDGRIVNISSEKGRYNKVTYDCFFEENVKATDGETNIFAENLDLLASKSSVEIYNNVLLNFSTGSLNADKIDYDFSTKYFKVSMFDDKSIKIKVTE